MVPDNTEKSKPKKGSGTPQNVVEPKPKKNNDVPEHPGTDDVVVNPYRSGKSELIGGFLLSGTNPTLLYKVVRALGLDSELGPQFQLVILRE